MRLVRLRAEHLRLFETVEFEPHPGLNVLTGANGAGKTSLIEAVYLLGYGRSFRAGPRDVVVQRGAEALTVFAEVESSDGLHRLGLQRSAKAWEGRVDGQPVPALSELFQHCAVVLFEPGSHELISGPAEVRRRFLDWGLFHVERGFLPLWRRYQRALKQRNALIRSTGAASELEPWEAELASSGEALDALRQRYVALLLPLLREIADQVFPAGGPPELRYQPGWRSAETGLQQALADSRERDAMLGYTVPGPHRANWTIRFATVPERDNLSRGQEKLAALACLLAQATLFAQGRGEWPIICLDDLGSELDRQHQQRVLGWLSAVPSQVLISGTEPPHGLEQLPDASHATFHVEHGALRRQC